MLRLKNRFATPHFSGMRDCLLNLVVDGFVCEVQIRQRAIHAFAKEAQSHEHYEFFRSCARAARFPSLRSATRAPPPQTSTAARPTR